jgi:hypothetical protein
MRMRFWRSVLEVCTDDFVCGVLMPARDFLRCSRNRDGLVRSIRNPNFAIRN